jgi:hypothetical protein
LEARQTLRGSGVPKGLVIVVAACAALGVALAGSMVAKDLAGKSSTSTNAAQAAPSIGSGLLDRNEEGQHAAAAPLTAPGRDTGSKYIDDPAKTVTSYNPGWDAGSVREGHGP